MLINIITLILVLISSPMSTAQKRTILVTGSTDGIGKATALELAKNSENFVIVHGRNESRCKEVVEAVKDLSPQKQADYVVADFADLHAVKNLADEVPKRFPHLNVLVNNAGLMVPVRQVTKDGLEMTFQVNHLAHFLLTVKLLPLLKQNRPSRVVIMSSMSYNRSVLDLNDLQMEHDYNRMQYGRTKLMNTMFGFALARRFAQDKETNGTVTCNVVEPGGVATKIGGPRNHTEDRFRNFTRAPVEFGAQAQVYLAQSPEVEGVNGVFFDRYKHPFEASAESRDEDKQEKLWLKSEEICKKLGVL